ncbi:MAG: arylesterase [Bdellovibrionota bacterium]
MKFILVSFIIIFSSQVYAKTLVIVGDSLTEGYGVAKEKAFPALIEEKIKSDKKDWKVVNSGVSGSTTASAPSRIKWILKSKPDLVMIALGANDGLRGVKVATSKKSLDEAMALLKKENIPIVIGGMHMPPNFGKAYTKEFNEMFVDLSKKYNAVLIPFILDKVAGDIKLNQTDGIHPNEEGHKIMADSIYNQIKDLLK